MNNGTKKVEQWVKKQQSTCPYIRWERLECRTVVATCMNAARAGEKCVYKHCPFVQQS